MRFRPTAVILTLALSLLAAPLPTEAQKPGKVYRIGLLAPASRAAARANKQALLQGLRECGGLRDRTSSVEERWAEGKIL